MEIGKKILLLLLSLFFTVVHSNAQTDNLTLKIENVLKAKNARIGVAIFNSNEKDTLKINNDFHFPMQSVMKFPIALAVLSEIDKGNLSFEQKIEITPQDLLPKTWSPIKEKFPIGLIGIVQLIAQPDNKIVIDNDIQLIHLQDSIFVHVTWHQLDNYGRFPSNGLIIIKNGQALMIDTPMDNDKTERLTRYLKDSMSVDLTKLIIGHFHDDCLGGLGYLQSIGIKSVANSMTVSKCKEIGLPIPSISFTDSLIFDFNGEQIDCRYFGAGHSFDNITVWIPSKKILFGGCLVKSIDSQGLGNLSDAVVADWDVTIEKVMKKYPVIKTVIPGHGNYGGAELLTHTIELVEKEKNK